MAPALLAVLSAPTLALEALPNSCMSEARMLPLPTPPPSWRDSISRKEEVGRALRVRCAAGGGVKGRRCQGGAGRAAGAAPAAASALPEAQARPPAPVLDLARALHVGIIRLHAAPHEHAQHARQVGHRLARLGPRDGHGGVVQQRAAVAACGGGAAAAAGVRAAGAGGEPVKRCVCTASRRQLGDGWQARLGSRGHAGTATQLPPPPRQGKEARRTASQSASMVSLTRGSSGAKMSRRSSSQIWVAGMSERRP